MVVLTPVGLASVWVASRDRRWRLAVWAAIALPTVVSVLFVAILRISLTAPPAPGYTVRFDAADVTTTTLKQTVAALPLSQWWVPGSWPPEVTVDAVGWAIGAIVTLVAACVLVEAIGRLADAPTRDRIVLAAMGGWLWLCPALLTGVTARWQQELKWGQGYLSVVFGAVGVALLAAAALAELKSRVRRGSGRSPVALTAGGALVLLLAVSAGLTAAANMAIVT